MDCIHPFDLASFQDLYFRKGSVEDEFGDGGAKSAKIRPMRVEMYGMNWKRCLGKICTDILKY